MAAHGIAAVIDAIGELVDYACARERFEADQRVREEMGRLRAEIFKSDSDKSRSIVVELAICKTKFQLLQGKVSRLAPDVRLVFESLLDGLRDRIDALRSERRGLVQGKRSNP